MAASVPPAQTATNAPAFAVDCSSLPSIVLRPDDETERQHAPGELRPYAVVDEMSVHITEKRPDLLLTPEWLLTSVQQHVADQQIPVDVRLVNVTWHTDTGERRPRVEASLRNHRFSDVRMLFGVDYMGLWANVHICVAMAQEPHPQPPQPPPFHLPPREPSMFGIIMLALGVLGLIVAANSNSVSGGFVSVVLAIFGGVLMSSQSSRLDLAERELRRQWEAANDRAQRDFGEQERRRAILKAARTILRNFKFDDMRVFGTAMSQVFDSVVEDMQRRGGKIQKRSQAHGSVFGESPVAPASNAIDQGV